MDGNNPNHNYGTNPQNNFLSDPNFINSPQGQLFLQMFNNQFNNQIRPNYPNTSFSIPTQVPNNNPYFLSNQSQQPYMHYNNATFDVPQQTNQPINFSPGGDVSSNKTPSEEVRGGRQFQDKDDVVAQLFPDDTRATPKMKWSVKDDEALVSAYLHAGGNEKIGTDQSRGDFWKTIERLYNEARDEASFVIQPMTLKALKNRWDMINRDVSRWVGVYAQAQRDKASGRSDEDVENEAHHLYQKKYNGVSFTVMHAWRELRHLRKWQAGKMTLPAESGGSSKRSQPDTPTDEGINSRPDGIKKAKKKGKQTSSSSVNIDDFTNAISEMNVKSSKREELGIQMLEYQRERDAEKKKQKEDERQWQLYMLLLSKTNLDPHESFMLAKLKEKYKYMFE